MNRHQLHRDYGEKRTKRGHIWYAAHAGMPGTAALLMLESWGLVLIGAGNPCVRPVLVSVTVACFQAASLLELVD